MMDGAPYPGASASPDEILGLAKAYCRMADQLYEPPKPRPDLWHAPYRLCALHAIELYVNAFLRFRGATPGAVRARNHTLWHDEFVYVLDLRKATREHLRVIGDGRDYLSVRYAPNLSASWCQPNRLQATLKNIDERSDRIPFQP